MGITVGYLIGWMWGQEDGMKIATKQQLQSHLDYIEDYCTQGCNIKTAFNHFSNVSEKWNLYKKTNPSPHDPYMDLRIAHIRAMLYEKGADL
jgi:hypothetical protein